MSTPKLDPEDIPDMPLKLPPDDPIEERVAKLENSVAVIKEAVVFIGNENNKRSNNQEQRLKAIEKDQKIEALRQERDELQARVFAQKCHIAHLTSELDMFKKQLDVIKPDGWTDYYAVLKTAIERAEKAEQEYSKLMQMVREVTDELGVRRKRREAGKAVPK